MSKRCQRCFETTNIAFKGKINKQRLCKRCLETENTRREKQNQTNDYEQLNWSEEKTNE